MTTIQDAVLQVDENVGFNTLIPSSNAGFQVDQNVGFSLIPSQDASLQSDENVLPYDDVPAQGDANVSFSLSATLNLLNKLDPANTIIDDVKSTAPHGFYFELKMLSDISLLTISDSNDDSWQFAIVPNGTGFLKDDVLIFSSEHNNKFLYIERGLDTIYLADAIFPGSIWPIMFPGINTFALSTPNSVEWIAISYYPTYWGV